MDHMAAVLLADPDYQEFIQQLSKDPEPMPTAEKLLELKEAEEKARVEAVEAEVTPLVAYMRKKRDEKARRMKVRTTIVALTQGVFATGLICQ
jgi:hypothetical protein